MPNAQDKIHTEDKRVGNDRRLRESLPRHDGVERRKVPERRQTSVSEISYFEWASHFVRFHGRALSSLGRDGETPQTGTPA